MAQSLGVLQPGDDSILDESGLVDNTKKSATETTAQNLQFLEQLAAEASRDISTPDEGESELEHEIKTRSAHPVMGRTLNNIAYEDYADYIDRPFSFISDDAEDLRAYGQTTGEKWKYFAPKFVTKVGANVIGSTAGLVYGGVNYLKGLVTPGESAVKNFWDNDFQRGLDSINDWMDDKLPHYYTKEEREYNFWRSMGTANFWANDVANGLSFVTGAVLSEYLSAGMASGNVAMKAKQLFTKAGKHAGAKTSNKTAQQLFKDKVINPHRLKGGLTTLRQLGTGAMYEAGVESRHHYDATIKHLVEKYKEDNGGKEPNKDQMAGLVDIATKSANAVFAGNVALVGYSNYMMFPKLFGKGYNTSRNSLRGTIANNVKDKASAYRELFKNIGRKEAIARNAWRVLKTPLYEGFVEEGGQKLLDLSGQTAALNYYQSKKDGETVNMLSELINSMDDRFADTYGSKEGQKEIGIGFILGALGIPTRGKTGKKDKEGKDIKKWQMNGSWASIRRGKEYNKAITRLKERLEKDPSALEAFERNFNNLVKAKVIQDTKDFASVIDSPWMFKNAEGDAVFNYISSRLEAGMEQEIYDNIDMVRNMSNEEFRNTFMYNDKNDLSDSQLETRKNDIADALIKRTETIKNTRESIDKSFVHFGREQKEAIVHAMAVSEDSDVREESIIKTIEAITGISLDASPYVDKEANAKEEIVASKQRQKEVTQRLPQKYKKEIEDTPEGRKVKRTKGIKEFTDPTHIVEYMDLMLNKKKELQAQIDEMSAREDLSSKEKDERLFELGQQMEQLDDRVAHLAKNINTALDPNLSAEEQAYLDEWKDKNPSEYAKKSEEVIQMLKDARKIRARRHRALSMYNELLELKDDLVWNPSLRQPFNFEGGNPIAPPEMMLERLVQFNSEDVKLDDKDLERIYNRHKGSVVEFEYENQKGETKTWRVFVPDTKVDSSRDKILVPIPSLDVLALLRKKEELEFSLKNAESIDNTQEALVFKTQLEAVEKDLSDLGYNHKQEKKNLNFLLEAKNGYIKTVTGDTIIREYLDASLKFVGEELSASLSETTQSIDNVQKELDKATEDLQKFLDSNIRSEKDQDLARIAHSNSIKKLQAEVVKAKKSLEAYKSHADRITKDIKILHGIQEESETTKTPEQILEDIFKRQWGGEKSTIISNIFQGMEDSVIKKLLHSNKPEYSLAQFRDLPENQDLVNDPDQATKLRRRWRNYNNDHKQKTLGDILFQEQDKAIELLASIDPNAQALVDRLDQIDKQIEGLAGLYEISENAWGVNNESIPGSKQGKKEFISLQAEKEQILNELEARTNEFRNQAAVTATVIADHIGLTKDIADHFAYLRDKMEELTSPNFKEVDEVTYDTKGAEVALEDIQKQADGLNLYLNSSPITLLRMMKTTGSHKEAIIEYEKMEAEMLKGKKVDPIKYAHLQSQLRLFKYLGRLYPKGAQRGTASLNDQMHKYRFMIANKNIIPKDLLDKITFYDMESKSFKYAKDMQGAIMPQDKETIKLILTDATGKPVLVDGQPIYSDLPGTELTRKVKDANGKEIEVYRYGKADLKPDTIQEVVLKNGKVGIMGELTPAAEAVHKGHITFREDALQLTDPKLIKLKGVSFTLLYRPDGDYVAPVRASKSIVNNKHEVKNIPVNVSLNGKVTVAGKDFNVPKGFAYTFKGGKLIPIRVNKLTGAAYNNVMNLFTLMATRHSQVQNKELTYEESLWIQTGENQKKILQVLKDTLYMGKHSFDNAPIHKRLNVKGNKIYFGEDIIEFHQLLAKDDNIDINKKFEQFVSGLHHQVNYFTLKKDIKARKDNYVKWNASQEAWKKRKAKAKSEQRKFTEKSPTYPSTEYAPFFEFKVGEDMEITPVKWDNYTEYLLGDGNASVNRPLDQMPAYSNLMEESHLMNAPQFLNPFVTLENNKTVASLDDVGTNNAKEALKNVEEAPVKDLSSFVAPPSGPQVEQGEQGPPTGPTVGTEEKYVEPQPGPDAVMATEDDVNAFLEQEGILDTPKKKGTERKRRNSGNGSNNIVDPSTDPTNEDC